MRMLTITLIGSSASLAYSTFPESLKTQSCSEFSFSLTGSAKKGGLNRLAPGGISILGSPQKSLYPKGPIPRMTPAQALITIQTMVDHSQKWRDGTTSRNIGSSSSSKMDLAALVNKTYNSTWIAPQTEKLNKLKRSDMENLDKQRLLTGNTWGKFRVGPPGMDTTLMTDTFQTYRYEKKAPLGIVKDILVKIDKFLFPSDFFTKALDVDKDPLERCLDEYNWVFHKEIEQLADEYEIKIREKGQVLEEIWTKCKRARTMAGVDVDTFTMEQYLALSQENQTPGVVKPEIGGNVNFEIKSQFMRELREDTFSGNKNEDAHDHIDRVLSIVGLFNIPEVSKDAVRL
ncbi:hypothetical protein Tco_1253052 [Tanacetum coccineum]